MTIHLKTPAEIQSQREGGRMLATVFKQIAPFMVPGTTTREIDNQVTRMIHDLGGSPSFKRVNGYRDSICIPINEQVVHTPPSDRIMKKGDLVTLDIGVYYKGLHTDSAETYYLDTPIPADIQAFMEAGRASLQAGLDQVVEGRRIGDISKAIYEVINGAGYYIIPQLTGHGVGKELHEDPMIPGYLDRPIERTPLIERGMVLAIEVIYAKGTKHIKLEPDMWSYRTTDRSIAACFEHTIAVSDKGAEILTNLW